MLERPNSSTNISIDGFGSKLEQYETSQNPSLIKFMVFKSIGTK